MPPINQPQNNPPSGWIPMPSIASQVETDPLRAQEYAFKNSIQPMQQPVQPQVQNQNPSLPHTGNQNMQLPNVGPQTAPPTIPDNPRTTPLHQKLTNLPNHSQIHKLANPIKIPLKPDKQETDYSCGPAALKSVLEYYKDETIPEEEIVEETNSQPNKGTSPENLIHAARKKGLNAHAKEKMTVDELKRALDHHQSVILPIQAWNKADKDYSNVWDSGHYVVAIGHDNEYIYFEDPALPDQLGKISHNELDKRWHDKGPTRVYDHYGIIMWKSNPEAERGRNAASNIVQKDD